MILGALQEETYLVRLPIFEGPLDLLLQLIEREKLDISAISIAQVADQFLVYVRALTNVGAGVLADFLVVAARLALIKSRTLLPPPPVDPNEEAEEDPAEALARQLREYKLFKEAASALRSLEEGGQHTFPRPIVGRSEGRTALLAQPVGLAGSDVTLDDLLAAARRALLVPPPPPMPEGVQVKPFTLTIHDQIDLIRRVTRGGQSVTFRTLLQPARQRVEIVVTLLAVLELVKRRQLNATQDVLFGEIVLAPVAGVEITDEELETVP